MARRKVDLRKVFLPSDSIAFVVIFMGLFIALFLDEMAVRLIGVCIAILGGVALFMMVSPRLSEISIPRPPRPTESPSFMSQTTKEGKQTRQVFDSHAYRETFGATDAAEENSPDENQIELFPGLMESLSDRPTQPTLASTPPSALMDVEFNDGQSSVRVIGIASAKGKSNVPPLAIENRAKRAHTLRSASPTGEFRVADDVSQSSDLVIKGPVTSEIQLSDDVVVRPLDSTANVSLQKKTDVPEPTAPTESQEQAPAESVAHESATHESVADLEPIPRKEVRVSTFMMDDDEEMEASEEPRKEFDYLLNRVLMVIRSATSARTAAFFWFNADRQQLVLEAKISDAANEITDQRKLPIGTDVVSRIALEGRPEIVTDINHFAELDLLPYYKDNAGTVSFVGVPVYFKGNVVGVLCADSKERNAYTDITVGFFGHFTKLIGGLVLSYTSKYELQQNSRTLEAIQLFRSGVADSEPTVTNIARSLFEAVIRNMDVSTIGVCAYDTDQRVWTIRWAKSVIPEYAELVGAPIDLENSLVGEAIRTGETIAVSVENTTVRLLPNEPEIDLCQFIALPMRSVLHTHGALFIENHSGTITNQDVSVAELLADLAGEMIAGLRESVKEEPATAVSEVALPAEPLSIEEEFTTKLRETTAQAASLRAPLALCYVMIDALVGATADDKPTITQAIMQRISKKIQGQLHDHDVVANLSDNLLAIVLVSSNARDAQFWAESLRRDTANTSIDAAGKKWSATISVGIAELAATDTWQTLMENTQTALDISSRSKNRVTVYS